MFNIIHLDVVFGINKLNGYKNVLIVACMQVSKCILKMINDKC
jgi:hypothetical protein